MLCKMGFAVLIGEGAGPLSSGGAMGVVMGWAWLVQVLWVLPLSPGLSATLNW